MSKQPNHPIRSQEEEINLREELEKYLKYWPWFVLGVIVWMILAVMYLQIATPIYNTKASVIIKDEENSTPSELGAFEDLGLLSGIGTNSIENEIGIFKSRRLMTSVVKELDLNISYYEDEGLREVEIYKQSPYLVSFLKLDERSLRKQIEEEMGHIFRLVPGENGEIEIINTETDETIEAALGNPIDIGFGEIIIKENDITDPRDIRELESVLVKFQPVDDVANKYREEVNVTLTNDDSSLIELILDAAMRSKAQDILDQLILEYNREAIEDKNLVARNTASFIDERLAIINEELDSVEVGKEEFKESNQLTDIEAESELFITNASDYRKRGEEVSTQLELVNAMLDYLSTDDQGDLLPANMGLEGESLNSQIEEFNDLVLERNRILSGSTEQNPVVVRLNSQIDQIKSNVRQSLERKRSNLEIVQEDLISQNTAIGREISSIPSKERQYRGIERQQNIKEALYLFLLEKREENSLSLAVTAPKAKIVDHAYTSLETVSPKKKIILLGALVLGLIIPFLIIYLRYLLDNKIRSRSDIENELKEIPLLGEVPKLGKSDAELISGENDRSVMAEAFRILINNLQYMLVNTNTKDQEAATLFVTSTVKGEGKTFTSFNLGISLANTGKKVVMIGGDLRNPQLQRYEEKIRNHLGVSDYLVNEDANLDDYIVTSDLQENLSLLASGSIPPNPTELWRHPKVEQLFKHLRANYDYILVDTAPSMLVADTFLINKYADLTLYVLRAGYTEKKLVQFAIDSKEDGKLHDVTFVLNNVELANFGYGNKYGYSYGQEELSFWERIKLKLT